MIDFYRCNHCGNIVMFLESSGVIPICCGDTMEKITPGKSDASKEKHVPVILVNSERVLVKVGSDEHPMTSDHHIDWIVLETNKGMHVTYLDVAEGKASAGFTLRYDERPIAAYEHCNLHGLWMCEA